MTISLVRSIGSVLLGLIVALALVIAVEGISAVLHPFPPDFSNTREEVIAHVANCPVWILVLLGGVGWAVTAFAATWLSTRLGTARHAGHGYTVGLILLAAAVFNMSMLPYPIWFWVLDLIALPLAICIGTRLAQGKVPRSTHNRGASIRR